MDGIDISLNLRHDEYALGTLGKVQQMWKRNLRKWKHNLKKWEYNLQKLKHNL